MKIVDNLKLTIRGLIANKLRSLLTILGVVIGICSVIIVYSAGEGLRRLILSQIESFGTDILETEIKVPSNKKGTSESDINTAMSTAQGVQITSLKVSDLDDIDKIPNVKKSYGAIMDQEIVSYENVMDKTYILGVTAAFDEIDQSEVEYGRFFTEPEDKSLEEFAILGPDIKEKLFGDDDAIGKFIKIRKTKFQVIGVLKKRGASMGMQFDEAIYVPVKTLQKKVMGIDHLYYMVHQVYDISKSEDTAEDIRSVLRENHDIADPAKDDFRVTTMQEMMSMLDTVTGAITLLLLAIVAISLIVGGVGILNIMYVSVTERTSEIGLRKAVGATYNDIIWQFLFEALIITFIGGIIGVFVGIGLSYVMAIGARSFGLDWKFSIPIKSYFVSIGFSLLFGLVFGIYPARRAARLNPIDALRSE